MEKRRGRPAKNGKNVEPHSITFIPEEWELLSMLAERAGVSKSDYLRTIYSPVLRSRG